MKKTYFTVGPSQLYPSIHIYMRQSIMEDIGSMSHRGKGFEDLYKKTDRNLRKLMGIPKTHRIFFVASALEGIERTLQNTVGKHSFHFVNGAFSRKASHMSEQLGNVVTEEVGSDGMGFAIEGVRVPRSAEVIFITENDTSTGTRFPLEDIQYLHDQYPDKLIAIDVVSSVPHDKIDFDAVDVAIFSVQKGFGLPAGLGVVIVSERAMKKAKELQKKYISIGSYHSFLSLAESEEKWQTPETPNILDIYFFEKVTEEMLYKGIREIRRETKEKAEMLYNFFDIHPKYRPFVTDPDIRSETTLVIDVQWEGELVRQKLAEKGLIVGSGYGDKKDEHIRIGNFPAHTIHDIEKLISSFKHLG